MKDARNLIRTRHGAGLVLFAVLLFDAWGAANAQEGFRGLSPLAQKKQSRELWLFFSPDGKSLALDVRALGRFLRRHPEVVLRPCLLVQDWHSIKKASKDFADTVKALRAVIGPAFSIPVWDREGLAFARELGIDRVPAVALLGAPGRAGPTCAHLAYGRGVKLAELLRCKRCR